MDELHGRLTGTAAGAGAIGGVAAALAALERGDEGDEVDVHAGCLVAFGDG